MKALRYYVQDKTLVVKGDFDGLSTGIDGGRKKVKAVLNHEVGKDFDHRDPVAYMDMVASKLGIEKPCFYFLTAVHMENLCVARDQQVTAFITAGVSNPCHDSMPGTINIILVVHGRMSEGAMASAIITATEAKAKALFEMGFDFTGTTTDAVGVLAEKPKTDVCGPLYFEYSGTGTDIGQSIYRCVKKGVAEGIKRQHSLGENHRSRLFVYAVSGDGPRWIEHPGEKSGKGKCEYYPCHFEGQDCTHCFCPLYPCEDPELGEWIKSSRGYPVWTCKDCTILHNKKAVEYLARHPDADVKRLKSI
ncbi:adenosylcobinamide amidohydrolase [Methanocella conradii]|uniref:adenosylcobinamide amidohydrolase n=1 Tax=Methanocella conradii TaxID=1175444 RepID=UPI001ED90C21|nr:adenosylcobinamide amidohydrolase [Methanocella conradii]